MITVDHSDEYPYAYYDEDEGVTSANNPEFWYALAMTKPRYPVPVTAGTAALSVYHQDGSPNTIWPYRMVKNELKYIR